MLTEFMTCRFGRFNLVEANKLSGDASLQGLVIDKWLQQGKLNAKDVSSIELLSSQVSDY